MPKDKPKSPLSTMELMLKAVEKAAQEEDNPEEFLKVAFFGSAVNAADRSKPIVTPIHNWSSQVVMAYVIGGIFELNNIFF